MLTRLFILVIFSTFLIPVKSQSKLQITSFDNIDSSKSLSIVYGWFRNPKNDKWTTKENEIKNIDKFEGYSIFSFDRNNVQYVAVVKEWKGEKELIFDTYILDYEDYVRQISKWEEHILLKFPILKHHRLRINKKEPISEELLGLDDLSGLSINPHDNFVFQYKFFEDSTVKFLFYVESCPSGNCLPLGLGINQEYIGLTRYIGKDDLYSNFFYKTTIKYFVDFIDSPLKN